MAFEDFADIDAAMRSQVVLAQGYNGEFFGDRKIIVPLVLQDMFKPALSRHDAFRHVA